MIKKQIYITKSGIVINPYNQDEFKGMVKRTSIYDNPTHQYVETSGFVMGGNDELEDDPEVFTTYIMDTRMLDALLPEYEHVYIKPIESKIMKVVDVNPDFALTELQSDIYSKLILSKHSRMFCHLETGYGKTVLGIKYATEIYRRNTLILCFSKSILDQWYERVLEMTDLTSADIVILDSRNQLDAIYENKYPVRTFYLCTPKILVSYAKHKGWKALETLVANMGLGLKIIDEAHRNMSATIKLDALLNISKTLYLSADLFQVDKEKYKKYKDMMKHCDIIDVPQETMKPLMYMSAVLVNFNSEPKGIEKMAVFTNRGFSNFLYMRYQFEKKKLIDITIRIIKNIIKTNTNNNRILVLTGLVENVDKLFEICNTEFSQSLNIGRFHGECPKDEKELTRLHADLIISTYKSFSTGMDVPGNKIRYIISLDQVDPVTDNQSAGRARRDGDLECFYFMPIDTGFKYCVDKANERLNYLVAHKIKSIKKIDM